MALTISLNAKAITAANLNVTQLKTGAATQQNYLRTGYNIVDTCLRSVTFSRDDKNVSTLMLRGNELGLSRSIAPLKNLTLLEKLQTIDISNNGLSQVQVSNIVNQLYQSALINSLRAVNYNIGGNNATPDVKALIQLDELQNNYGFTNTEYCTIRTDQSVLTGVTINLVGVVGKTIIIDWNDGIEDTITLVGGVNTITHNYTITGVYDIMLKGEIGFINILGTGDNEGIKELHANKLINCNTYQIKNNLLTIAELPQIIYNGGNIDFSNNAITDTDTIICNINEKTTNAGSLIDLSGGTNAALTATGLACKASLLTKGWLTINNN